MFEKVKQDFQEQFGRAPRYLFSAPGRTELSGNHTDHQLGRVLAAAVDRQTVAAVAENDTRQVRLLSQGYPLCVIDLTRLEPQPGEEGTTNALIRGMAAQFAPWGLKGFDACVRSDVLSGSGLSSSAAFEVLMGVIFNRLTGAGKTPVELAQMGQYAENVYFGKPCGLMDQTASSVGNIIGIDFEDPAAPVVTPIPFDFAATGYSLCIIDTGASHADLTEEYAAITRELKQVCRCFGKEHLRQVPEEEFYAQLRRVRQTVGDRGVLRAIHVYDENRRVQIQTQALLRGDFQGFLAQVRESGLSSWRLLQNVVPGGRTDQQEVAYALTVAEKLLGDRGACRVHGGGFAGTIQAFVPVEELEAFRKGMDAALFPGSCQVMSVRPQGGMLVEIL